LFDPNGIPTSGQIRDTRKQLGHQRGPVASAVRHGVFLLAGTGESTVSLMRERGQQRVEQVLNHPDVRQFVRTLATAGSLATTSLELASDEAHDVLEEHLARLNRWPYSLLDCMSATRRRGQ
jgi:hypothetical protein